MLKAFFILLWVFFTIFSIFGAIGLDEIIPVFNNGYAGLIIILNFYLSNVIGSFLGGSLGRVNRIFILLATLILLLVLETYGVYYLFWEVFEFEAGFWSGSIFLFTLIFVLTFGGIRQVMLLSIESVRIGFNNYFNTITQNMVDTAISKANPKKNLAKQPTTEKSKRRPEKVNLNNELYNY